MVLQAQRFCPYFFDAQFVQLQGGQHGGFGVAPNRHNPNVVAASVQFNQRTLIGDIGDNRGSSARLPGHSRERYVTSHFTPGYLVAGRPEDHLCTGTDHRH